MDVTQLFIQPITEAQIRQFVQWEYEPPYNIYNIPQDDVDREVAYFLDPDTNCYGLLLAAEGTAPNELLGYVTFGRDAQVPGGDYGANALDIGIGMRPDLTGQGQGYLYVQAILDFARARFQPPAFRVTVAEFNVRSQRVWLKHGFEITQRFIAADWVKEPFVILVKVDEMGNWVIR